MSKIEFIQKKVKTITKKYDTRDPFEICKNMNIHVYYKDLGKALKAYYFYQSRIKNIVINTNSSMIVRRVLCAHELGHAILHGKLAAMRGFHESELYDSFIPTEYEANLFAAELIISDDEIFEMLNDKDKSFFSIAKELYVPVELLDFKFRVLKHKGMRVEVPCIAQSDFLKKQKLES